MLNSLKKMITDVMDDCSGLHNVCNVYIHRETFNVVPCYIYSKRSVMNTSVLVPIPKNWSASVSSFGNYRAVGLNTPLNNVLVS